MSSTTASRRQGLSGSLAIKVPCLAASTGNLTLSGEQTVDGVAVVSGDRVLVKDQTTASENGIYDVSTAAWTRTLDFDGNGDATYGTLIFVLEGTQNTNTSWKLDTSGSITIGTTSLTFTNAFLSDAAALTYIQSGTGAVQRGVQDRFRDWISVFDFMTAAQIADVRAYSFSVDVTDAVQAAWDAGQSSGRGVDHPAGGYLIAGNLTYKTGIRGVPYNKNNQNSATIFGTSLNDGTAMITVTDTDRYYVDGFVFDSYNGSATNAIGFKHSNTGGVYSSRAHMARCYAKHLTTGFDVDGFLSDYIALFAYSCTTGFKGVNFNASRLFIVAESCTTGVDLTGGGNQLFGSVEDNTTGIVINGRSYKIAMWFEGNTIHGKFGDSATTESIDMTGSVAGAPSSPVNTEQGFILYDVKGFNIDAAVMAAVIDVRDGCRNVHDRSIGQWVTGHHGFVHREIYQTNVGHQPIENIVLNPFTRNALRWGFTKVVPTNLTTSLETTTPYSGGGLRLTGTGTASYAKLEFYLTPEQLAFCLGRTLHFGCWLYIPDASTWDNIGYDVSIASTVGGNNVSTSISTSIRQRGGWVYVAKELAIDATCTAIVLGIWLNNIPAGTAELTDYMIVGSMCAACDVDDTAAMKLGEFVECPDIGVNRGGNIEYYNSGASVPSATMASTDNVQSWALNDKVLNNGATLSTDSMFLMGYMCTAAGSSTAAWTPMYMSGVTPAV